MHRKLLLAVLVVGMVASVPLARAADAGDQKWQVSAEVRSRWERLENYLDLNDNGSTQDAFTFMPYRFRVGVDGQLADDVSVKIQVQNWGSWGNQDPQQSFATNGFFGFFGPVGQNLDGDSALPGARKSETSLYQGYVALNKIGGSDFWAKVGRMESPLGTGLIIGNEEFYNGTVFDGIKAGYDEKDWSVHAFYFRTSQTEPIDSSLTVDAAHDNHVLDGGVFSLKTGEEEGWGDVDVYGIGFQDGFTGDVFDPIGAPHLWTFGAHWWRAVKSKKDADDFPLDWNIEGAMQTGDVTDVDDFNGNGDFTDKLDFGGTIIDGSVGWNFAMGDTIHRVSGGIIYKSGDDNVTDKNIDSWVALFPSNHGRYGNADFFGANIGSGYFIGSGPSGFSSGLTAYNIAYDLNYDNGEHMFGGRYWKFEPTEDKIKTSPTTSFEIKDFGTEWDLWYQYRYSENVSLYANYSNLSPDDGLTGGGSNPNDSVTRFYAGPRVFIK